jgi:hypothetical protein
VVRADAELNFLGGIFAIASLCCRKPGNFFISIFFQAGFDQPASTWLCRADIPSKFVGRSDVICLG